MCFGMNKNLTEKTTLFYKLLLPCTAEIFKRKSKQATTEGRQCGRFLSALGLVIHFLNENGLPIVTDYQATTNEFGSRSTTVKMEKKKKKDQSSLNQSPAYCKNEEPCLDTGGGQRHQRPERQNVIAVRKRFLPTAGATTPCIQTRKVDLFGVLLRWEVPAGNQCHRVTLPGSTNKQSEPGLFSDFTVTTSGTVNKLEIWEIAVESTGYFLQLLFRSI